MSARKASSALRLLPALPPLLEREAPASEREWGALAWQGAVRLAPDRALGTSAPRWQQQVRTGLLERALTLGASHRAGSHLGRPEAARRLLAHLDALAEAGLSLAAIRAFADEAELDRPGALWALTILFGCQDSNDAEEAFESWIDSLDPALLLSYRGVLEIAEALAIQPNPRLRQQIPRWAAGPSAVLTAIALETMALDQLSDDGVARLIRNDSPLVHAALERLLTRSPGEAPRSAARRPSWIEVSVPALAHVIARARVLARDPEPLFRLRERHPPALDALGPYAIDLLALAGEIADQGLAKDLALGFPTTPTLLDALGRAGLPSLFPRLLAALDGDDFEDDAHAARVTALGARVTRPSLLEEAFGEVLREPRPPPPAMAAPP